MINKNDVILFIGLGGAGQRHLRIFRDLLPKNEFFALRKKLKTPLLNPNFTLNESNSIEKKYDIKCINEEYLKNKIKPKLTIISTPTKFHTKYSLLAKSLGSNVFVEKPGISSLEDFNKIKTNFLDSDLIYKIGFQRSYLTIIEKLKNLIKESNNKDFECELRLSSYIPDWHPYENFKELYACKKELGGGVLLTECHEIDILNNIFGEPLQIESDLKREEKYNLNVYDTAIFKVDYKNCKANINISFFRKPLERNIQFKNQDCKFLLDLNKKELHVENKFKKEKFKDELEDNDLFIKQAKEIIKLKNNNKSEIKRLYYLSKFINKTESKL